MEVLERLRDGFVGSFWQAVGFEGVSLPPDFVQFLADVLALLGCDLGGLRARYRQLEQRYDWRMAYSWE